MPSAVLYMRTSNSCLAEQKNKLLRRIEMQSAYMKQIAFLMYLRYYLHRLNRLVDDG